MASVAEVLEGVRDHPDCSPYNKGDGPLVRFLNRYTRQLAHEIRKYRPDLLALKELVTLASYDFEAGHEISGDFTVPQGGEVRFASADRTPEPLTWVPWTERNTLRYRWGAYLDANVAKLLGREGWWDGVEVVELWLDHEIEPVAARKDDFDLPGDPTDVLVEQAVAWITPARAAYGLEAERLYVNRVTGRDRAQVYRPPLR